MQQFKSCATCKLYVHEKDSRIHENQCGSGTLTHGCVRKGVLFAVSSSFEGSEDSSDKIQKKRSTLPSAHRNQLVLIHVSAMELCGLVIGQPCVLQRVSVAGQDVGARSCAVAAVAWPSRDLPPTKIALAGELQGWLGIREGDVVSIRNFKAQVTEAAEVTLVARQWHDHYEKGLFINHIRCKLDKRYLDCGSWMSLNYFGGDHQFFVRTIRTAERTVSSDLSPWPEDSSGPEGREGEELSTSLANLSLNSSGAAAGDASVLQTPVAAVSPSPELDSSVQSMDRSGINSPAAKSTPRRQPKSQKKSKSNTPSNSQSPHLPQTSRQYRLPPDDLEQTLEVYQLSMNTKYVIEDCSILEQQPEALTRPAKVMFSDLGGLSSEIRVIRETLTLPLKHQDQLVQFGLRPVRGLLLFGPSGTGKSVLAQALGNELGLHTVHVTASELWSKYFGETEGKLQSIFQEAKERAPSLIVMDDADALCGNRDSMRNDLQRRVATSLLSLMDGLAKQPNSRPVTVIGVTNKRDGIDAAFRHPGRFDKEIEIGVPSPTARFEILSKLLEKTPKSLTEEEIREVADVAHGYVGADLVSLCQEAGIQAVRQCEAAGNATLPKMQREDLAVALTKVKASAMREVQLEVPKVLWSDIGGQEELKQKLRQAVEWPLRHPEAFSRLGVSPPRGLLMYGPPGCSKTLIAKALATETGLNFLAVKGPDLFSKWVGESERAVREVFRRARAVAPSIIFFDEIDAVAAERGSSGGSSNVEDRVLAQLLTEIDGVERLQDVTIVAATNRPDMIDKALLRPGRLDRILYVPPPDAATRLEILKVHLRHTPVSEAVDLNFLVQRTDGYSGAEVTAVCREAALAAMQENLQTETVELRHFEEALQSVKPQITPEMISFYTAFQQNCGVHSV